MPDLATAADVEARLTRTLDDNEAARLGELLADASAKVRDYTGQQITAGESTTRHRVRGGKVTVAQKPVTDVTAVVDLDDTDVAFEWDETAGQTISLTGQGVVADFADWPFGAPSWVKVTYEHGFDTVPDVIVAVVCSMVMRALGLNPEDGSKASESIDGYAYTTGTVGAAGAVGLLPDEKETLDGFRNPQIGTIALGVDR